MKSTNFTDQTIIRYKLMRELVGDATNKIILDIGAGKRPISNGIISKKTLKLDGIKEYNPDIICNINEGLKLEDNSVDIIIAGEIIEHILNPFKFISECNRVLRKDGEIILSTPNICSLKNRIKMIFGSLPEHCAFPSADENFERHIIDFNLKSLKNILTKKNFKVKKHTTNGIIIYGKLFWPLPLTPTTFGESLIIKARKIN